MVGKLVCFKAKIGTNLKNICYLVCVCLLFKMGSQKMLVKLHQVLLKSIGFVHFQRKIQAIGFIWKILLKYEVRTKCSEGDKKYFKELFAYFLKKNPVFKDF